jgi:voltage-gated potassium channel
MNLHADAIRFLYESSDCKAVQFRYALLGFDILMLVYLVVSSFFYGSSITHFLDVFFGIAILLDFLARLAINRPLIRYLLNPITLADLMVILSLLLPIVGENLAFLRVARMFRLFRSYHVMDHLGLDFPYFQKYGVFPRFRPNQMLRSLGQYLVTTLSNDETLFISHIFQKYKTCFKFASPDVNFER